MKKHTNYTLNYAQYKRKHIKIRDGRIALSVCGVIGIT